MEKISVKKIFRKKYICVPWAYSLPNTVLIRPNLSPQITFRLETRIYIIRFWQNLAWSYYLTLKTSLRKNFSFIVKFKMSARGQRSKTDQIWPHKSHFGSAFGSVHLIWTNFGMDILLDPSNKPAQEFFIYCKVQNGHRGSKVQNRPNLTPQIPFWLDSGIYIIRFGQNLAWIYFLTLQTSLRKNLSVKTKSKMAAGGQRPKLNKFDSTNHSLARHLDLVHQIWTNFDMNILLDPTNKVSFLR